MRFNNRPLTPSNLHSRPPTSMKRHVSRWQWYLLVIIILSPFIYFIIKFSGEKVFVTAQGQVRSESITLRAPKHGYIDSIAVDDGEQVKVGQTLIHFVSPATKENISYLKQELTALKNLKLAAHNQTESALQKMQQESEQHLQTSIQEYQRFYDLHQRGLVTALDIQSARQNLHRAQMELSDIKRQIVQNNFSHDLNIEAQYAQKIRQLSSELKSLETISLFFNIKAPEKASVIHILTHKGEFVNAGQELIYLASKKHLHIRAFLDSKFSQKVQAGAKVRIVFANKTKITGTIVQEPIFAQQPDRDKIAIRQERNKIVVIIKPDKPLPPALAVYGLPVTVYF